MDPKLTVAINFVIYRELTPIDLQNVRSPDGNSNYATLKLYYDPIKTDTFNYSIDFLPNHEYILFRVTPSINTIDPICMLPQSPMPTKVLIFQGNTQHQATDSYTLQVLQLYFLFHSQVLMHFPSFTTLTTIQSSVINKMGPLNLSQLSLSNNFSKIKPVSQ